MADEHRSKIDLIRELQELRQLLQKANERLQSQISEGATALRRSEERFRAIVESSVDWIWEVNEEGVYTYVGPQIEAILGYKPSEVIGWTPFDLMPPEEATRVRDMFQDYASSGKYFVSFENINHHKNGRLVILETNAVPFYGRDGTFCGYRGVDRDITERKHAQETLRSSEEKYRVLVEASPDAVTMADLDGRITFASQRLLDLHGSEHLEEMYGRDPLEFVVPEQRRKFQDNISKTLEQGITRDIEYDFLRADGTSFPGETSAVVVRDATGAPMALMALVRDITERKQAEENIRKEQERLRRMLRASDRDRQLITYEIHDGISQRLVGALMHLQAFQSAADWKSEAAKHQFNAGLNALREASSEARRLMNRTRTPILDKYGLSTAIADLIDHFMELPDGPEITYHTDVQFKRLASVLENALYRVAQETIANAVLHSKSESVRVTLKQVADDIVLEVQDWGIGFSEADVRKDRYGLAGVRERARLLGKGIEVESTPGVGTHIRATFPVLQADQQNGSLKDDCS